MMNLKMRWMAVALAVTSCFAQTQHNKSDKLELPLQLSREAPLPANSQAALALSEASLEADPKAEPGTDGRVILTYGAGTPTIICALLEVSEIDLEPGESVAKDGVDSGDAKEFEVVVKHAGSGASGYDYLILKPTVPNIETTMTVGTDRRVYYFRLRSTENKFISRVAFAYPEDVAKANALRDQAAALAKAQAALAQQAEITKPEEPMVKPWKYSTKIKGHDSDYLKPLFVGDDGAHTEIHLSQEARMRGLPVLQIRDATGPIPANSHWEENKLIVDALFTDGCLLQGVGWIQQRYGVHREMDQEATK